ncbi:MAG: purine-nucleoside phosphorylase [Planctomycetes bacterium]|nr:purine-nucleoside phosphorylase [Planctomycetota bacterium]
MKAAGLAPIVNAQVTRLAASLAKHGVQNVDVAFVLGSGLGVFADRIEKARVIPYTELEGMPMSSVPGHAGKLVLGEIRGVRVVAQQGRVHLYEGWSADDVTRCVRALARCGVARVVLTNAAGGLHKDWPPGTLMRIVDHVNMQGTTPLAANEAGALKPWDLELGSVIDGVAKRQKLALVRGVYAGLLGPSYETPAEVRMLAWVGADAVGMSTVAEALAARASGMKVAGISCITNFAAGITQDVPNHEEVIEVGKRAARSFSDLLEAATPELAQVL